MTESGETLLLSLIALVAVFATGNWGVEEIPRLYKEKYKDEHICCILTFWVWTINQNDGPFTETY